jgi:hypothetical protein
VVCWPAGTDITLSPVAYKIETSEVERVAVDHLTGLVTAGRASGGAPAAPAAGAGGAGGSAGAGGSRTGASKDAAPPPSVTADSPCEKHVSGFCPPPTPTTHLPLPGAPTTAQ